MKVKYRGYEINCKREESFACGELLYYSVYRESDGLCVVEDFTTGEDSVRDFIRYMKGRVDEFIETKGESENMKEFYHGPIRG